MYKDFKEKITNQWDKGLIALIFETNMFKFYLATQKYL